MHTTSGSTTKPKNKQQNSSLDNQPSDDTVVVPFLIIICGEGSFLLNCLLAMQASYEDD